MLTRTLKWFGFDSPKISAFTKANPSPRYLALLDMYAQMHTEGIAREGKSVKAVFLGHSLKPHIATIKKLLDKHQARTVLDFGSGKGELYEPSPVNTDARMLPAWGEAVQVTCYDPGYEPYATYGDKAYDVVISTDVVEHIPEDDIGWVLDDMFSLATKAVFVVAACYAAKKIMPDGANAHCTLKPPRWWVKQIQTAAGRCPHIDWVLCTQSKSYFTMQDRRRLRKPGMRSRHFYR